jgi:hypothetical protein
LVCRDYRAGLREPLEPAFWGGFWGLFFGGLFLTSPAVGHVVVLGYLATVLAAGLENAVLVGATGAPEFDAIARILEADDLLLQVIAFADDAEVFHIESSHGQALHRLIRLVVGGINGYRRLMFARAPPLSTTISTSPLRFRNRRMHSRAEGPTSSRARP